MTSVNAPESLFLLCFYLILRKLECLILKSPIGVVKIKMYVCNEQRLENHDGSKKVITCRCHVPIKDFIRVKSIKEFIGDHVVS